jgi:DNA-binding response OmpR family regulator
LFEIDRLRKYSFVNDPNVAIEQIRQFQPDLILLDIVMPGTTGLDLLKEIRDDQSLQETTILMLSAADKKSKYQALNLGAVDFINKPVDQEDLEVRVRKALRII